MAQLLQLLTVVYKSLLTTLGIVTDIQSAQAAQATEATVGAILTQVNTANLTLEDATFGLAAIKTAIDDLTTLSSTNFAEILTDLGDLSTSLSSGVTVSGVTGGGVTDISNAVWETAIPTSGTFAYIHLQHAGTWAATQSTFQHVVDTPRALDGQWKVVGDYSTDGQGDITPDVTFPLDLTTILPTDATPADWLTRVYSSAPWTTFDNNMVGVPDSGANSYFWIPWITQDDWVQIKAALTTGLEVILPPIWPGLSGVTLGTPVAISTGVTVTGPMAGVLISLTSVPADKAFFDFDGDISYRNLGALTFKTDNGDDEPPQSLGFTSGVFLPKSMAVATSCLLRSTGGVVGTITPFTIP